MRIGFGSMVAGLMAALSLGGCAAVGGGMQNVAVSTVSNGGHAISATCELTNHWGSSFAPTTPAVARVYRDAGVLSVVCTRGGAVIGQTEVKPVSGGLMASYPSRVVVRVKKVGNIAAVSGTKRPANG